MAFGRDLGSAVFTSVETFSAREFNQIGVPSQITRTFAAMFRSFILLLNVSRVAVIWFGGKLVDSGNMPTGDLTAFLAYIM